MYEKQKVDLLVKKGINFGNTMALCPVLATVECNINLRL